jgi:cytidyltransferase-like protein
MNNKKKEILVVTSGGFDPLHIGHVRLIQEARKLGDRLVVLLNNDNWLMKKKGFVFMSESERKEILENIKGVDEVVLSSHEPEPEDMSVAPDLSKMIFDIFAKGGDRDVGNMPGRETVLSHEKGFKIVYNLGDGGKVQSSSWLVANSVKNSPCPCRSGKFYIECGLLDTETHTEHLKKLLNS